MRSPRSERGQRVSRRRKHLCAEQRLHRPGNRPVPRRPRKDTELLQRSLEVGAQPRKSSGQGGTPVCSQRSTSSTDSTLHSPRSISSTARCNSCSSSVCGVAGRASAAVDSERGSVGVATNGECHAAPRVSRKRNRMIRTSRNGDSVPIDLRIVKRRIYLLPRQPTADSWFPAVPGCSRPEGSLAPCTAPQCRYRRCSTRTRHLLVRKPSTCSTTTTRRTR